MGRPAKTIAEHRANGTYRPSRHGAEPVGEAETELVEKVERPAKLSPEAVVIWEELVAILRGVIRQRDVPALTELARWIVRSDRIAEKLDALDPTDTAFKAMLIAAGIATDKVSDLTKRFGISPADRMRLRSDAPAAAVAKVPVRPQTKLDRAGAPKKGK